MSRSLVAIAALVLLPACSLFVSRPPAAYRAGIVPDCDDSYLPPAIDYTGAAASLASIALDDKVFCSTCPTPYLAAAVLTAIGVYGHVMVRRCRGQKDEHRAFLALPRERQDALIDERKSREREHVGSQ